MPRRAARTLDRFARAIGPLVSLLVALAAAAPLAAEPAGAWDAAPAPIRAVLERADALAGQGLYERGFEALRAGDPPGGDPWIAAKTIAYCRLLHVRTSNHVWFAFVDLAPGGSLDQARRSAEGEYRLVPYDPRAAAAPLLGAGGPAEGILRYELGMWYADVWDAYGTGWLEPPGTVIEAGIGNLTAARDLGVADPASLARLGSLCLRADRNAEAAGALAAAVLADPGAAVPRFDLMRALVRLGREDEALAQALAYLALPPDRADDPDSLRPAAAALFAAQTLEGRGDDAGAERVLRDALPVSGPDWWPEVALAGLLVRTGRPGEAASFVRDVFARLPADPRPLRAAAMYYRDAGAMAGFIALVTDLAAEYDGNPEASGNLYFHRAVARHETGDGPGAAADLAEARARFERVLPPDHGVFATIDGMTAQLDEEADDER